MEIQFRADYAHLQSQQTNVRSNSKPAQNHDITSSALTISGHQSSQFEVYSMRGSIRASDQDDGSLLTRYRSLVAMAKGQAAFLTQASGSVAQNSNDTLNMDALKAAMPSDLEGLTEYWNKENTAERIFTIALLGFEPGDDREAMAEQAISMISQAYNDVQGMLGGYLPQLVLDTRAAVLDALEQFKGGTPISEIAFG
ncbi:hypothetical protein ACFL6E_03440 [Candidatus Neomarinimicrobiota bacterium]